MNYLLCKFFTNYSQIYAAQYCYRMSNQTSAFVLRGRNRIRKLDANEHFIPAILVPAFFIPHIYGALYAKCWQSQNTIQPPAPFGAPPNSKASSSCVRVWSVRTHLFAYICCVPCVHIVVVVDVDSGSSNCTQDAHQLCRSSAPHRMCFLSDANERYRVFLCVGFTRSSLPWKWFSERNFSFLPTSTFCGGSMWNVQVFVTISNKQRYT